MKKAIVIERTRKDLSALSGLYFFENLLKRINLEGELGKILPFKRRDRGLASKKKFLAGMFAFISGADCLDDLDDLRGDPLFRRLTSGGAASTTMGKFIRSFRQKHFEHLQDLLLTNALLLRQKLSKQEEITVTMDSTPHEQHGLQMEGVEWDYKNRWCLNSQNAFDEFGFCLGWDLRSGGSYSGNGAVEMLERIFSKVPRNWRRYFRADSAYSTLEVYNCLLVKNVNFGICLKENVWGSILDKYERKITWRKTRLQFFESNKCEIGSCLYPLKGLWGRSFLRVVFVRAKKKDLKKEDTRYYDYYAIVTDMSFSEMNDEEVCRFYRKRANAENHIKDLKYGMDFKHFPCQKLMANKIWGMMGLFAYNLMRFASWVLCPQTGCFLKKVRRKMVYLGAEVVSHARSLRLRFSEYFYQEVERLEHELSCRFAQEFFRSDPSREFS